MRKIVLFEYFLKKLVVWYCDYYRIDVTQFNNHSNNDLSKLKVIKLHFFTCSTSRDALEIFNDFHAMPYGHVESEIYNLLDRLSFFTVTNSSLLINDDRNFDLINSIDSQIIDNAILSLMDENSNLIALKPFQLVELSHKWFSWRYNFQQAKKSGLYSKRINNDLILQEEKYYSLF
ncbi:hypothetical protein ACR79N_26825 [Sphingobacterium siyangense]|uniref:hypothetical protein n=1 Tax=Sphingobacterium siyangense TaxID=459529 RepID=UPI003DA2AADF